MPTGLAGQSSSVNQHFSLEIPFPGLLSQNAVLNVVGKRNEVVLFVFASPQNSAETQFRSQT
jgi:hypothetical protein